MTDTMRKYLEAAKAPKGTAMRKFEDHKVAYFQNGWVKLWGYAQNSMTARFVITEAGLAALEEEA